MICLKLRKTVSYVCSYTVHAIVADNLRDSCIRICVCPQKCSNFLCYICGMRGEANFGWWVNRMPELLYIFYEHNYSRLPSEVFEKLSSHRSMQKAKKLSPKLIERVRVEILRIFTWKYETKEKNTKKPPYLQLDTVPRMYVFVMLAGWLKTFWRLFDWIWLISNPMILIMKKVRIQSRCLFLKRIMPIEICYNLRCHCRLLLLYAAQLVCPSFCA